MARATLGSKRICSSCNAKFYDLGRDPAICPECGAQHPQASFLKPRRVKPPAPRAAPKKPVPKEEDADDIALEEEDEDDEAVDDLDDDDDDLGDVVSTGAKKDGEEDG